MNNKNIAVLSVAALVAAGCAAMSASEDRRRAEALAMMKVSFKASGQATMDRLEQDDLQRACSKYHGDTPMPKDVAAQIEKAQLASIKYPSGGFIGDWKAGERIAQSGIGKQYSDDPKVVAGGNCYACHELSKAEQAHGTIGPSLYNFAKLRGFTPDVQKYAYGKVYNPDAFSACSSMPRFGHNAILTEQQIKDVVALLMDPESPVNK